MDPCKSRGIGVVTIQMGYIDYFHSGYTVCVDYRNDYPVIYILDSETTLQEILSEYKIGHIHEEGLFITKFKFGSKLPSEVISQFEAHFQRKPPR